MADQDEVTQGAIPPKVSPFAKPEGASPITPAAPGAPRPITVRLKPVGSPTDSLPNVAPQAPAAAAPAVGIPAAPPVNPRSTARVPVPESVAASASAIRPATVRLRPVAQPAQSIIHTPGSTQSIAKVETLSPSATVPVPLESVISPSATVPVPLDAVIPPSRQPQHPPTPGSNPLSEGIKPPSAAQVQAAKSKTSRISLDSAIGVAPVSDKEGPKTIRLKRPSDLSSPSAPTVQKGGVPAASAMRQTSRIPDSALPTAEPAAAADSSAVTQKKTLKIKRPGVREEAAAEAGAGVEGAADGVQMTPISPMDFPAPQESSVFTTVSAIAAIAATVVLFALAWCLAAHAIGPGAGKNALASIKLGGVELPWAGRLN